MLVVKATVFFPSSSHQLYGDPNHHLLIRQAGERFIESNTENSCNEYIHQMSMQGTSCDALFVQAVADCQNAAIHIQNLVKILLGKL